jgi:hypothetical protein
MSSPPWGHVAEWLRNGLQNRVHQFNSGRGLQPILLIFPNNLIPYLFRKKGLLPLCYHSHFFFDFLSPLARRKAWISCTTIGRSSAPLLASIAQPSVSIQLWGPMRGHRPVYQTQAPIGAPASGWCANPRG